MREKITTKRTKIPRLDVRREVEYVIKEAQRGMTHVVSVGSVIFFCTASGDAWVLDPEDHYALCLAKERERLPFRIMEMENTFAIDWNRVYMIKGEEFWTMDISGTVKRVIGYPTHLIEKTIRATQNEKKKRR